MPAPIHIVEPTLTDQTGHCYSFIASFCHSSAGIPLCLWANRNAEVEFAERNVQVQKHFHRKLRRFQSFGLYRRLLRTPGKILVSTAGFTDLALMKWAARGVVPRGKVYLYFHWINASAKKRAYLAKLARKQPNFVMLGPTSSVVDVFKEAGFANALIVPYPISGQVHTERAGHDDFTGLLYAGAARQDKGISQVVDLVEHMSSLKLQIPFKLQISSDHRGKYDAATQSDIKRLENISYPALKLFPETLSKDEYAKLYVGAICIQLYNPADFADRISGVTLDALSAGSPIVTTAGTWIARIVQRFGAGLVIDSAEPEQTLLAIQKIIADYSRYNENAYKAGLALQQENCADFLFETVAAQVQ